MGGAALARHVARPATHNLPSPQSANAPGPFSSTNPHAERKKHAGEQPMSTNTISAQRSRRPLDRAAQLQCIVCKLGFDFAAGETAIVLRHVAYYYDFVHSGNCLSTALDWIFAEPGYDVAEFAPDRERVRILRAEPDETRQTSAVESSEPRRYRALIEHSDGSCWLEVIVREVGWEAEPGGAEFPEERATLCTPIDFASQLGAPGLQQAIIAA
jgi:hypothetical protein